MLKINRNIILRTYLVFRKRHPSYAKDLFQQKFLTQPKVLQILDHLLGYNDKNSAQSFARAFVDYSGHNNIDNIESIILDLLNIFVYESRIFHEPQAVNDITYDHQNTAIQHQTQRELQKPELNPIPHQVQSTSSAISIVPQIGRTLRDRPNPFVAGNAVAPTEFYGRQRERRIIKDRIGAKTAQSVSLVGLYRIGKSSLLEYIAQRTNEFCLDTQNPIIARMSLSSGLYRSAQGVNEGLRRAIQQTTGEEPWKNSENGDSFAIKDALMRLAYQGRRTILLIDEFRAFDNPHEFYQWGDDWRSLAEQSSLSLALVIASHRPLFELYNSLHIASPFGNIFEQVRLTLLQPSECIELLRNGFATNDEVPSSRDENLLDELAGGWPFYTQLVASHLWSFGDHDEVRRAFAEQTRPHFERIYKILSPYEQKALYEIAQQRDSISDSILKRLRDQCLLREDGRIFSSAFVDYLREI